MTKEYSQLLNKKYLSKLKSRRIIIHILMCNTHIVMHTLMSHWLILFFRVKMEVRMFHTMADHQSPKVMA